MTSLIARTTRRMGRVSLGITNWIGTPSSIFLHTVIFIAAFSLHFFGVRIDDILLMLTTIVSLEAIYLSIFIQMTVNRHAEDLETVGGEIEVIQEDVKELGSDVEGISEDVEEISEDVEEISKDIDKIQEEDKVDEVEDAKTKVSLEKIEAGLQKLLQDIEVLKQQK